MPVTLLEIPPSYTVKKKKLTQLCRRFSQYVITENRNQIPMLEKFATAATATTA